MKQRKQLSPHEIIARYKKGERDFSNIDCTGDFIGIDLSGINFKGSKLEYAGFEESNLTEANFTDCNLQWSSFRHANLTKTNFKGADLSYSILNDAIFDKTIMRKADLSWCLLFNVNLHAADITDAKIATIATHPSQLTGALGFFVYFLVNAEGLRSEELVYQGTRNGTTINLIHQDLKFFSDSYRVVSHDGEGNEIYSAALKVYDEFSNKPSGTFYLDDGKVLEVLGRDAYIIHPDDTREFIDPKKIDLEGMDQ